MLSDPDAREPAGALDGARYLISDRTGTIGADLLSAAPAIALVVRLGAFSFDIDLEAARAADVAVCRWPLAGAARVAEHVVLQILALAHRLNSAQSIVMEAGNWGESRRTDENIFAFNWSGMEGAGLSGRTIGVLGFGEIGAELARRLSGWETTVLYHKRRRLPPVVETDLGIRYAEQGDLLAGSDVVVNLLPYTGATDLLIGTSAIAGMKDGAWLVSCGSGATVDEAAAAAALESGRLAGVALDTFEWEPVAADNPLVRLARRGENVVLTPHVAGGDRAGAAHEREGYYSNIMNHLAGRPLLNRLV
jgi:lactate dehydrogenase-like 2-hydroxyacid dehydrogenase